MEGTSKQCMWRDCRREGHTHSAVVFAHFGDQVGGIYLCGKHCKQARQTGHMDLLLSQIKMERRKGA